MSNSIIQIFIFLSSVLLSDKPDLFGIYCRINKAGDYSVSTMIELKRDYTFIYKFQGHMVNDEFYGTYRVDSDNKIYFTYDTLNLREYEKEILVSTPKVMKFKNEKLFFFNNNKVHKKTRMLSNQRRFLLFGEYSRRRKTYLLKQTNRNASP
jgi:hypothetical protein